METPMHKQHFATHYAQARQLFLGAAERAGASVHSLILPSLRGAHGEQLAMDAALLGPPGADAMLVVSSGLHGVEGLCGSRSNGPIAVFRPKPGTERLDVASHRL